MINETQDIQIDSLNNKIIHYEKQIERDWQNVESTDKLSEIYWGKKD
jgi:hypothetical protein